MPGNDANSPSITSQLRNEELERCQAMKPQFDMFAEDDNIIDTNVSRFQNLQCHFYFFVFRAQVQEIVS